MSDPATFYGDSLTGEQWCPSCVPGSVRILFNPNAAFTEQGRYLPIAPGDLTTGEWRDGKGRFLARQSITARCHSCGAVQPRGPR